MEIIGPTIHLSWCRDYDPILPYQELLDWNEVHDHFLCILSRYVQNSCELGQAS